MSRSTADNDSIELHCKIDRAFGISRSVGKAWMDAARYGDLTTMRTLLDGTQGSGADDNGAWRLGHYDGQGTSYGFIGSTALHWAAANGDTSMTQMLLALRVGVNVQNHGGSTALHSAVANGQLSLVRMLLEHGANPSITDCCGDTPLAIIQQKLEEGSLKEAKNIKTLLIAYHEAMQLLESMDESSRWPLSAMRQVAAATGAMLPGEALERGELTKRVSPILQGLRSVLSEAEKQDEEGTTFLNAIRWRRAKTLQQPEGEEEEAEAEDLHQKAVVAKDRGNALYAQQQYTEAIKQYTTAIALFSGDATFYSNRSACYLCLERFVDAVKDARTAMSLDSSWAKPYHRCGSALLGLGRFGEAASVFKKGLELLPGDAALLEGLQKASSSQREEASRSNASVPIPERKPWFDCPLCENRTRDRVEASCCGGALCGTCWKRRREGRCPRCGVTS